MINDGFPVLVDVLRLSTGNAMRRALKKRMKHLKKKPES